MAESTATTEASRAASSSVGEFIVTDWGDKVGSGIGLSYRPTREMENIRRGPTFGVFVTISTEASMQNITAAELQSTRVQTPLSSLF
jgi:hypothetical protein